MSSTPSAQSLWGGACPLWGSEFAFCLRVSGYRCSVRALTAQEASYREETCRFPVHGLYPWGPWVLPWDGGTGTVTVDTEKESHSFLDRGPLPLWLLQCPELSLAVPAGGDGSECIPEWPRSPQAAPWGSLRLTVCLVLSAEWVRTASGPRLRVHPSCLSAEPRLPEHLSLGRLAQLLLSAGDARGLEGEGVRGAPTHPQRFPSPLQFQPKSQLPWDPCADACVMDGPKPVETAHASSWPPGGKEGGHRPCPRVWHAGRLDPALQLLSHTGPPGHSARLRRDIRLAHPVLSCRGHSPRPVSSPTYCHRPLLSLGEKSHPGPRGGHVWTPAAVPARPAATRALHRVRWSCGGTSFPQQPSNPHAVGRAGSLGYRHPCGCTAVPCSSGSGFPVVKSKPACSVCQGWLSFGLPIIASCRKQCHVGGQDHASGFQPCSTSARMSIGHSPEHGAVSPLLQENVDFAGARARRQILDYDGQTSSVPVERSPPRWCWCPRTCLGLMGAAHRTGVDPSRQHCSSAHLPHCTSARLPHCTSAHRALRPLVPTSPRPHAGLSFVLGFCPALLWVG